MTGLVHPETLTDGVVELRRWRDGDLGAVRAVRGGTPEEAESWLHRQRQRPPAIGVSLAFAPVGADATGYVGLIRRPQVELGVRHVLDDGSLAFGAHDDVAGIGYWTAPAAQGRGLATRAVVIVSRWALAHAGLVRVEALVDPRNIASQRVVEKSGFRREGQLRSYLLLDGERADALVYSLVAGDL